MIGLTETDDGTKARTREELQTVSDELPSSVATELDTIWHKIWDLAIELCPKKTGALAVSIELESEYGMSGTISATSLSGGDFYENSIYAGNDTVINPETGKATSLYAGFVHDGHMIGHMMWEGVPFLTEAVLYYEEELDAAIDKALDELGVAR